MAVSPEKFESQNPLPSLWSSLDDGELSEATPFPGCTLVHMTGFIGRNETHEGSCYGKGFFDGLSNKQGNGKLYLSKDACAVRA